MSYICVYIYIIGGLQARAERREDVEEVAPVLPGEEHVGLAALASIGPEDCLNRCVSPFRHPHLLSTVRGGLGRKIARLVHDDARGEQPVLFELRQVLHELVRRRHHDVHSPPADSRRRNSVGRGACEE